MKPPKNLSEYGNGPHVRAARGFVESKLVGGEPKPAMLLYGPPGTGKTTLARCLANEYDLEIVDVNGSDLRTGEDMRAIGDPMLAEGVLVLIDEVEGVGREGAQLGSLLSACRAPVVLTANSLKKTHQKVKEQTLHVNVPRPNKDRIKEVGRAAGAMPRAIARAKTYRDLFTGTQVEDVPDEVERAILMGLGASNKTSDYMFLDYWILDNTDGLEALDYDLWRTRYREVGNSMSPILRSVASLGLEGVEWPSSMKKKGGPKEPIPQEGAALGESVEDLF